MVRKHHLYLDCCVGCLAGWCAEQPMALLPPALNHEPPLTVRRRRPGQSVVPAKLQQLQIGEAGQGLCIWVRVSRHPLQP